MKSSYKKLGQFIREVDIRNVDNKITYLRGVSSVYKCLMESKANLVGTDMTTYKIVKKDQFAFNPNTARMGDKIPIALNNGNTCLVSQIYPVFEIINQEELNPEYLMMWFRRPEFDRYARFKSHGSAREIFDWNEMCNVELPVPSIDKQKEIIKEYNVLVDRINLNNKLIQKLEETARAIYKQWFVDFEFPDDNGKAYKSSGGEMVYSEEVDKDIPRDWGVKNLGEILTPKKGRNITREQANDGDVPVVAGGINPSCYHDNSNTESPVITISASGANAGYIRLYQEKVWASDSSFIDKAVTEHVFFFYVFLKMHQGELTHMQTGTSQPHIYPEHIELLKIINISDNLILKYNENVTPFFKTLGFLEKENENNVKIKDLLLSRLATIKD